MNLIYIFADQWRRDAMGIYDPLVRTPQLNAFSQKAAVFDCAISSCPLCSPARASLMTGLQPIDTGVFTNCKPGIEAQLDENAVCLSDLCKAAGYRTGYIGKWHLDRPDGSGGWDAFTPPGPRRHGFDFWYSYGTYDRHNTPHYWDTQGRRIEVHQWSTEHETDIALRFIRQEKKNNFVLFLSYNPPHSPYNLAPDTYTALYEGIHRTCHATAPAPDGRGDPIPAAYTDLDRDVIRGYYAAVTALDFNIGRVLRCLDEEGLSENTYVVISADHGDMLGDHNRIAKHIWYDGSIGIPLLIGGADVHPCHCADPVATPDQSATILGLLGISPTKQMTGTDFSPLVRSGTPVRQDSALSVAFPSSPDRIEEFRQHGLNFMDYGWRCVVSRDYKLVVDKGHFLGYPHRTYLYDRKQDPYENTPIDHPAALAQMEELLRYWMDRTGDGFLNSYAGPSSATE